MPVKTLLWTKDALSTSLSSEESGMDHHTVEMCAEVR